MALGKRPMRGAYSSILRGVPAYLNILWGPPIRGVGVHEAGWLKGKRYWLSVPDQKALLHSVIPIKCFESSLQWQ
jgi:hypothetical protein